MTWICTIVEAKFFSGDKLEILILVDYLWIIVNVFIIRMVPNTVQAISKLF